MARKKKKAKKNQAVQAPPNFGNRALKGLSDLSLPDPKPEPPPEEPVAEPVEEHSAVEDDEMFLSAMRGVDPIERTTARRPRKPVHPVLDDDEIEARLALARHVEGFRPPTVTEEGGIVEGHLPSLPRKVFKKLKQGGYPIQRRLDLHGLSRTEAHQAVAEFIMEAMENGSRSLLIVHGRGNRSKDQEAVLKGNLVGWLESGRGVIGGQVLAFCSAKPADGGSGAMYVLLRRARD